VGSDKNRVPGEIKEAPVKCRPVIFSQIRLAGSFRAPGAQSIQRANFISGRPELPTRQV
jgi:hypothetical protein